MEVSEHYWENRHDRVYLFECRLAVMPSIRIDNREIVEARAVTLAEARALDIALPLRAYLKHKQRKTYARLTLRPRRPQRLRRDRRRAGSSQRWHRRPEAMLTHVAERHRLELAAVLIVGTAGLGSPSTSSRVRPWGWGRAALRLHRRKQIVSSFLGEFTRVEMGHMRINSAGNGRKVVRVGLDPKPAVEVLRPENDRHAVVDVGHKLVCLRRDDGEGPAPTRPCSGPSSSPKCPRAQSLSRPSCRSHRAAWLFAPLMAFHSKKRSTGMMQRRLA